MTSLIDYIRTCREPVSADLLWSELEILRRNGIAAKDLPPSKSELQRALRLAKSAGLVQETWPPGASEALWSVVPAGGKRQATLFWT